MNYPAYGNSGEWPKWIYSKCPHCGEMVPRFREHICDPETKSKAALSPQDAKGTEVDG